MVIIKKKTRHQGSKNGYLLMDKGFRLLLVDTQKRKAFFPFSGYLRVPSGSVIYALNFQYPSLRFSTYNHLSLANIRLAQGISLGGGCPIELSFARHGWQGRSNTPIY